MKHAGSVRCAIPCWMFKLWFLLCFASEAKPLTPPRIIYGGWTPIMPGHPFYFGPRKNLEPSYHPNNVYYTEHSHEHFHEPPIHEVEHHVEHHSGYVNPDNYHHYDGQPDIYRQPEVHTQSQNKGQHITYGHKPKKNIFSYYPPQSAYDGPKQPKYNYKPVYFEIPRKPLDVFEIPHQKIPYIIPSVKDVPLKSLNLHDLNSVHHGDDKTFLKINPLGNVDSSALRHIGHVNIDPPIQYADPKHTKYPVILDSSGGTPKLPARLASLYTKQADAQQDYDIGPHKHTHSGIAHVPYDVIHHPKSHKSANDYEFQLDNYQVLKRPLNPIETKHFRNSPQHAAKLQDLNSAKYTIPKVNLNSYNHHQQHSSLPVLSTPQIYPASHNLYSNQYLPPLKSLHKPLVVNKNLLSSGIIGKNIAKQMKKYLGPKFPHYNPVRPFYPINTNAIYPTRGLNAAHLPLRTLPTPLSPSFLPNYLHKNVKMQTLYKNPSVVTNIRGAPAIVEREVAIIHVPISGQQEYLANVQYPNEKDYLYYTASTPESTQILNVENSNDSIPYVTLNKNIPHLKNNESYTHITLDYGRGQDLEHVTFVDGHKSNTSPEHNNAISDPQYQYQYIFVSSNGIHDGIGNSQNDELRSSDPAEEKKQFFHAYYAPPDHIPPPGYVKMTVHEFNNLFKNAEIRYVDKDPVNISRNEEHGNNDGS